MQKRRKEVIYHGKEKSDHYETGSDRADGGSLLRILYISADQDSHAGGVSNNKQLGKGISGRGAGQGGGGHWGGLLGGGGGVWGGGGGAGGAGGGVVGGGGGAAAGRAVRRAGRCSRHDDRGYHGSDLYCGRAQDICLKALHWADRRPGGA